MRRARSVPDLDPRKLSLDGLLRQALSADIDTAMRAWRSLGALSGERPEAGYFLLGLMQVHRDDPGRMKVLVGAVASFPSASAAEALKHEFLRLPSSRSRRAYLSEVFRVLTMMPPGIGLPVMKGLIHDKRLSSKWRRRFEEAIDDAG